MELQAVTGLLHIVDGERIEEADVPGLLAQSAPPNAVRGRNRDFLFVHLSIKGDLQDLEVMYQDLLDSISGTFYATTGSITAALRKAILTTNQLLLQYNLSGIGATVEGAVSCAVQHNQDLYFAQAGEALAYVGHNFGIERLSPSNNEEPAPLGRTAGLNIRLNHSRLFDGDMVLLADPRLAHLSTEQLRTALIDVPVADGVDSLAQVVGFDTTRAILVEFAEDVPVHLPEVEKSSHTKTSARILPPPTNTPVREVGVASPAPSQMQTKSPLEALDIELVETTARKATSKAALGMSRGTGWFADLLSKIRSPKSSEEVSGNMAVPAVLALAIPVIIGVVVVGAYIQRGQVALLGERKGEISNLLARANLAVDLVEKEILYRDALEEIIEVDEQYADDSDLIGMKKEAMDGLDELSGVIRQPAFVLHHFPLDADLDAITVDENQLGTIYVLDSSRNSVYRISTDENLENIVADPVTILTGGQVVGNYIVGTLADMMWRPGGNQVTRDGLAILDERGALVSYFSDFSDLRAVTLDLASQWNGAISVANFSERLYVVDNGTPAIWRYFPEGEGFKIIEGQESIEFSEEADLEHVIDMAIYSEDGSIVMLYDDGRLRRYANGRLLWSENDLNANGLPSPLLQPVSVKIAGRGLNSSIYVADPGSQRIVQLSLGGTFLAHYKSLDESGTELYGRITDFDIIGNPEQVVVVADNTLYITAKE